MIVLTADRLRQLFEYDPETGVFKRLTSIGGTTAGDVAGCLHSSGHLVIRIDHILYKAHRLAWLMVTGAWPEKDIDHIDGNQTNNRFSNLRDVDDSTNMQNQRTARADNKVGLLGVSLDRERGSYKAQIKCAGKTLLLGRFKSPLEAHQAYLVAKRKLHAGCTI